MNADDYERGRRALRRRLALDFEPLRDTLARGLDLLVQNEAAVYCTAAVEALCEALFTAALLQAQAANADAAITVSHLQLALRGHPALSPLLWRVPSAGLVLAFFLDDATSSALYSQRLIASSEAPHLRRRRRASFNDNYTVPADAEDEDELIAWHARARREWTRRADDPFADEDLAAVLKGAHPAFSLSYNATALLSALIRELLNATCDQLPLDDGDGDEDGDTRRMRMLTVADVSAALDQVLGLKGQQQDEDDALFRYMTRTARDCVHRFASAVGDEDLPVQDPSATTDLRFRVVQPSASSASAAALLSPPLGLVVPNVSVSAPFSQLVPLMCKRGHIVNDRGTWLAVYRGREVDARATPGTLELPVVNGILPSASGSILPGDALVGVTLTATNAPFVFFVPRKWWDDARRNEARRGRLASQRPQDARVRSLVAATESRVKRALRRSPSPSPSSFASASASLRIPVGQAAAKRNPKRSHSRSAATLVVTLPSSPLLTSLSTATLHTETNMNSGDDSLSALLRHRGPNPNGNMPGGGRPRAEDAAGMVSELADALRTAALEAEAAAARIKRTGGVARDEWTGRIRVLDTLVERTQAARAAAAQILACVEDGGPRP